MPLSKAAFVPESQKLAQDTELISVIRQRTLDDEPFLVEHSYYLKSMVGEIRRRQLFVGLTCKLFARMLFQLTTDV